MAQLRNLLLTPSPLSVIARHTHHFASAAFADTLPAFDTSALPIGWQLISDPASNNVRLAATGERSRGGWQGVDQVNAFAFTGSVPADLLLNSADCTLRELQASGIRTEMLPTSNLPACTAVRSSGYVSAMGLRAWTQFSTYVANPPHCSQGIVIYHSLTVTTQQRLKSASATTELTNSVHRAFLSLIG